MKERILIPKQEFATKIATELRKDTAYFKLNQRERRPVPTTPATIYEIDFDKVKKMQRKKP